MNDDAVFTIDNPPGAKPRARKPPRPTSRTVRGYSTKFTPHGDTGRRYLLGRIPAGLWTAAQARAKRDGFSMRALLLQLLTEYVERTDR